MLQVDKNVLPQSLQHSSVALAKKEQIRDRDSFDRRHTAKQINFSKRCFFSTSTKRGLH